VTGSDVVVLAGGTGGAKLARGFAAVHDPERLTVIANTGDDIELYGAYVSPDPDLVCFWLADRIDDRGWGLRGDSFAVMDALRALGAEVWFNLGDRDLAWCLERARMLAEGSSATAALQRLKASIGVRAHVLPMSDDPVRTWVRTPSGWHSFQEFMIRERARGPVQDLEFRGAESARAREEALGAIAGATVVVIGPSNPLASIGPILAVPGMRDALLATAAPVVAVSPIVGGEVLKGPTAAFLEFAALERSAQGIVAFYGELLDGIVADEPVDGPAALQLDTRMDDAAGRARVARQVLAFAERLAGG
jgi:LPPG:FO 2-phospho-L-lactate transferase